MATRKRTLLEKNLSNFINNNFDKKDRKKEQTLHFEWLVNSMHIWHESSQSYNANVKIGKDVSLGDSLGGDSFYISVNNGEKTFTLKDNIDEAIIYIKKYAKSITFVFIQTKLVEHINWNQLLSLIDVPLTIWKGNDFGPTQPTLKKVQEFIDSLTDETDEVLGKLEHKISIYFYSNKNNLDIKKLEKDWSNLIKNKYDELKTYFTPSNIIIELRGSDFINEIYEKLNSNEYILSVNKNEVIHADELKYLIGYITAKELLDSIAPKVENGNRILQPDVFRNNIRLYLGQNEINQKIEKTLIEEPKKFHFYNNGLTITTKEIKDENSKNYTISSVNIVNGCQTANSIYNVHKNPDFIETDIKIPVKIIVAQDKDYENITISTNTQNGIGAKDLVSITSIQKELQEEFKKLKLLNKTFVYKRQKGESIDSDYDYIIQIDDILRSILSTLLLFPNKVSGYFDATTLKYIDNIFDERFVELYIMITVIFKYLEDYLEETHPNCIRAKFHILYLIYRISSIGFDYRDIESYFKEDEDLDIEAIETQNATIKNICHNLRLVALKEENINAVIEYIVRILNTNYKDLVNITDKKSEKILYKPVEKLKRTRATPVFDNFDDIFNITISNIISDQ